MNQENTEQPPPNMNPTQPEFALIIAKLEALEANQKIIGANQKIIEANQKIIEANSKITNDNLEALTAQQSAMNNTQTEIQKAVNKLIPTPAEQSADLSTLMDIAGGHEAHSTKPY